MKHYNPTITADMNRIFNLKGEGTSDIEDNIIPVIEIKRVCDIVLDSVASNSTSATIYTTPTDKDTYIVAASLHVIKDVTATSTRSRIKVTINGVARYILRIDGFSVTVQDQHATISFSNPIKVDRGSVIAVENETNNANVKASGTIIGYNVETLYQGL